MRRTLIAICVVAAILSNYNVSSIDSDEDENGAATDVEQIPNVNVAAVVATEVENGDANENKKQQQRQQDEDAVANEDYENNESAEVNKPPLVHSVAVASGGNVSERSGKYSWDDGYISNLEINEQNYDWNGKLFSMRVYSIKLSNMLSSAVPPIFFAFALPIR